MVALTVLRGGRNFPVMGFAGNLRTLSLGEVVQTLNRIKASGILRIASMDGGRDLIFQNGELIGLVFGKADGKNTLLRLLILLGKMQAEDAAAISATGNNTMQVVDALLQRGVVTQETVSEAMNRQATDELYNLNTWDSGDFVFIEAGQEEPEASRTVDEYAKHPLAINLNALLIESARRMDEWNRHRERFGRGDVVLAFTEGSEAAIQQVGAEYPGSAVIDLIDGVRTLDDLVRDSIATRLDIYAIAAELLEQNAVRILAHDDIVGQAKHLQSQRDFVHAALLSARALDETPNDGSSIKRLSECLLHAQEFMGEAQCYASLSLAHLAEGAADHAIDCARKGVQIAPRDPAIHFALVRCLIEQGKKDEAIGELRQIVPLFLQLNRLEDARGTCLKILELDPVNEETQRQLAQIFSKAAKDTKSEDVVICVQCGEVNHRESTACTSCKAPLHLTCVKCGRIVAGSDKICIFCGADPHTGISMQNRRATGSPATSRIVDPNRLRKSVIEKGGDEWRNKLQETLAQAKQAESSGNLDQAIEAWKDIAHTQNDSSEVTQHIRDLEKQSHESYVEGQIEVANKLRKNRNFMRAAKAYRNAIKGLGEGDPRLPRLNETLTATNKDLRRVSVIYAISFLLIGAVGFLVAKPYIQLRAYRQSLAVVGKKMSDAPVAPSDVVISVTHEIDVLKQKAENDFTRNVRDKAKDAFGETKNAFVAWREANALHETETITQALDKGDVDTANTHAKSFQQTFERPMSGSLKERLTRALADQQDHNRKAGDAPKQLEEAKAQEKSGELGLALATYRVLAAGNFGKISDEGKAGIDRLDAGYKTFSASWDAIPELMKKDLVRAQTSLKERAADAKIWAVKEEWDRRSKEVETSLASAAADFDKIAKSDSTEAFEKFIADHPAAPAAATAKARISELKGKAQRKEDEVAKFQKAMADKAYEQAYKIGKNIHSTFGAIPEVRLPLLVTSVPEGASVSLDGKALGATPLLVQYDPALKSAQLKVSLADYQEVSRSADEFKSDWQCGVVLQRLPLWKASLKAALGMATVSNAGVILVDAGENLIALDRKGAELWRHSVYGTSGLTDNTRAPLTHPVLELGDSGFAYGLADAGVQVLDREGTPLATLPTKIQVRGRPIQYQNEIFGSGMRMAFAGGDLFFGEVGKTYDRIALSDPAQNGPVLVVKDFDRLLVVATVKGRLIGYEESNKDGKPRFSVDLEANDVGQLVPTGDGGVVMVLDGSRIACYSIGASKAESRWMLDPQAAVVGDPVVADGRVSIAVGKQILLETCVGKALTPLALPAPASCQVAVSGSLLAVGCGKGELQVFKDGRMSWSTPCAAPVGTVAFGDGLLLVGLTDGTLLAFKP